MKLKPKKRIPRSIREVEEAVCQSTKPYYDHGGITIYHGDCREILPSLGPIDSCVSDPPYGLEFMGKGWDKGVPGVEFWKIILAALKPGAMLMAFGGTRTYHRLACAIEDAGFGIRDCLSWLYGSGFPKSLDVSKAIDKSAGVERSADGPTQSVQNHNLPGTGARFRNPSELNGERITVPKFTIPSTESAKLWNGWGTALKPAWEPIILAMKSLDGTFADNAQRHGVAGLNVNEGRIPIDGESPTAKRRKYGYKPNLEKAHESESRGALRDRTDPVKKSIPHPSDNLGRWPANVALDEEAARLLDEQSGSRKAGAWPKKSGGIGYGSTSKERENQERLESNSSGASRFYYTSKASKKERGEGNKHPTVKPLALMRWLLTLVATPTGGVTLDPFAGSGTTLVAAQGLSQKAIGIELEEKYCEIAANRLRQGESFSSRMRKPKRSIE